MENKAVIENVNDPTSYLPFIDEADAMERFRGNKKLFCKMLRNIKKNTYYDDLEFDPGKQDLEKTEYLIHSLKGVAGNLSLIKLFKKLEEYNIQLKNGQSVDLTGLDEIYNMTLEYVEAYLSHNEA